MQTIIINDIQIENFIKSKYGDDRASLINDFMSFIKTELIITDLKNSFDEVSDYKQGKKELNNVDNFINRLKSGN